jgi:D-threo-aldose 1-dehydrogenase
MRFNSIPGTPVAVTQLGLGTAQLGDLYGTLDTSTTTAIVDAAWDSGIRYFDTAPHYGLGLAEERLGQALRGRPRDDYVISTKVGRLIVPDERTQEPTRRWDFSPSGVRRSLDESMERLQLQRIDIVLIHDPQEHMREALDEAYPALDQLRREGVVGAIGVGSGTLTALETFAAETEIDVLMMAGRYTMLEQPATARLMPLCQQKGISILNAGVFNTGLLALAEPEPNGRYEYQAAATELFERARMLAAEAKAHGITLPEAALKFAARPNAVVSVVIGADSPVQVNDNVELFERDAGLDSLWKSLRERELIDDTGVDIRQHSSD